MVIMIKELYDSVRMLLIKKKYFFWIKLLRTGKRLYHFLTLTQYGIIQIIYKYWKLYKVLIWAKPNLHTQSCSMLVRETMFHKFNNITYV